MVVPPFQLYLISALESFLILVGIGFVEPKKSDNCVLPIIAFLFFIIWAIIIVMVMIMRKFNSKMLIWFISLCVPFYVGAYSDFIIPGGETLGIEVNSRGVMIVGFYKINGELINQNLQVGDKILKVDGEVVEDTNSLADLIDKHMKDDAVTITIERNHKELENTMQLSLYNGTYRTGLYVKANVLGIGTLSYIDPETNIYGVLGHSLNVSNTNQKIEIKSGKSYDADVTSFTRSVDGTPGSKNADINKNETFGTIEANTNYGVFGKTEESIQKDLMKVGKIDEVELGKAFIHTTDTNNEIKQYEINILEVNKDNNEKNIYFEINDEALLAMSGGIVQGMSGSPIIQNDMIVGAVTRVLVDDVNRGYGISIVTMLEEGDKLLEN